MPAKITIKGSVAPVTWPILKFWDPLPILGKLRTWNMVCGWSTRGTSLRITNYPQRGSGQAPGAVWNFETLPIFRTGDARNLEFGVWMEYVTYSPANDILSSKGAWPGSRDRFLISGPLPISGWLKVETWNLVCDCIIWGTTLRMTNYPK